MKKLAIIGATLLTAGAAVGQELAPPEGPVILTISGAIEASNRGAMDPFHDALAGFHGLAFETAVAFDRPMLEALGQIEVAAIHADWPQGYTFAGPTLHELMMAVGARGDVARTVALDGYTSEVPRDDWETYEVIAALTQDGAPLAVGGHGPIWLIYPTVDTPSLQEGDDLSVWSVYHIVVE